MLITINAGANNKGGYFPPREGATQMLVQNPATSSATLYFNQGFSLTHGEVPAGTLEITPALTTAEETGGTTGTLEPGDSVLLNTSRRGVWIHTGPQNVAAPVNITPLA